MTSKISFTAIRSNSVTSKSSKSDESTKDHPHSVSNGNSTGISLKKYHYRYLGELERDLDSFNKRIGFPVEIGVALRHLRDLAHHFPQPGLFLRSPLLQDFIEFILKIPEGLVPAYNAALICSGPNEDAIRAQLKYLPLENYCALRTVSFFMKSVSFSVVADVHSVPFELIDKATRICEALTPAPRDDRFKPIVVAIFKDPMSYFYPRKNKNILGAFK